MCENLVSYWVARGYDYREVKTKCGNTDVHGERAVCEPCRDDPDIMQGIRQAEENIRADNAASHSAGWGDW